MVVNNSLSEHEIKLLSASLNQSDVLEIISAMIFLSDDIVGPWCPIYLSIISN